MEKDFNNWELVNKFQEPVQENGNDCGLYILSISESIMEGTEFDLKDKDMVFFI